MRSSFYLVGAALLAFCAAGSLQAQSASKEFSQLKKELNDVSKNADKFGSELSKTMDSLRALPTAEPKNLSKAFGNFRKNCDGLEKALKNARDGMQSLKEKRQSYFAAWDKSSEAITDPDLKKASEERREKVKAQHTELSEQAAQVGQKIDGFMSQINDLRKFLSADQSAPAIASAKPTIDKVLASGTELSADVQGISKKLSGFASGLS